MKATRRKALVLAEAMVPEPPSVLEYDAEACVRLERASVGSGGGLFACRAWVSEYRSRRWREPWDTPERQWLIADAHWEAIKEDRERDLDGRNTKWQFLRLRP